MRVHWLTVFLLVLSFWAFAATASADPTVPRESEVAPAPVRIAQGVAPGVAPVSILAPDGRPSVAWGRGGVSGGSVELMLAAAPEWSATSVARLDTQGDILLYAAGEATHLAWPEDTFSWRIATWRAGEAQAGEERSELLREGAAYALDSGGRLHFAWPAGGRLEAAVRTSEGDSEQFSAEADAEQVVLALDARDMPHLAWIASEADGGGLYYVAAGSETPPVQVAAVADDPRLALGPTGVAHLLWLTQGDLYYANSLDWSEQQLVVRDLAAGTYDLAAGPAEQAWITWADGDLLRYVNSSCWVCSRGSLAVGGSVSAPRILVDSSARPHVFWVAADGEAGGSLYYTQLLATRVQLEVTYPIGGEVITGDTVVRAASNLPASELLRVDFYLEAYLHSRDDAALVALGPDSDGLDGWTTTLATVDLQTGTVGRIVALGTTVHGDVVRATGDWFTVRPASSPWIWLAAPDALDWGAPPLLALHDPYNGVTQLDLSLVPTSLPPATEEGQGAPSTHYLGRYTLEPLESAAQWRWVPLGDVHLPDGDYIAEALLLDESGQRVLGSASVPVTVRGPELPAARVTSPSAGEAVEGVLHASAQVQDPEGRVRRVAFYLERDLSLLPARHGAPEAGEYIRDVRWLGLDTDGSDGWQVRMPVTPLLDGDSWFVRAVAFDDYGFSTSARSPEPFRIVGRERALAYFARPSPNGTLREEDTIQLVVTQGGEYLRRVWLYLKDPEGGTRFLGEMSEESGRWAYVWDTRAFAGEFYTLIAVLEDANGRKSSICSGQFSIADRYAYHMRTPQPGETLSGPAVVTLQPAAKAPRGIAVAYYYRDDKGLLHYINSATWRGGEWMSVWDTSTVLDGEYYLVAHVYDREGRIIPRERWVRVNNHTPVVTYHDTRTTVQWQGIETVCWQAEHPMGDALTVRLEYSPDAGDHWLTVARALGAEGCYDWNTVQYPDATEGMLRLSATDGSFTGHTLVGPFKLANHNLAPVLSLLAPESNTVYGSQVDITWRAWDPDEDTVLLDLAYRVGEESWVPLARGVHNTGRYRWNTEELAATDALYDLRVVARDVSGASSTVIARGLAFRENRAPTIRLLGPQGGSRFSRDLLVVWDAKDPDDDELLIDIYYSENAGQTWLPLAEGVANTGYYVWQVSFLPSGSNYRVRVVARDGLHQVSDESSDVFAVGTETPPRVMLLSPLPASVLSNEQFVRWSAVDADGAPVTVSLWVRPVGETAWQSIVEGLADDSFYVWDTTQLPNGAYEFKLTVSNGRMSASSSLAEPISIENNPNRAPGVMLDFPQQGDVWGDTREIRWRAWDPDGDPLTATLSVRGEGDAAWQELATVDARAGYYLWEPTVQEERSVYEVSICVSDGAASAQAHTAVPVPVKRPANHPPSLWLAASDAEEPLADGVLSWVAEDPDGDPLYVELAVSSDDGLSWSTVATDLLPISSYDLTYLTLPLPDVYRVRLRASDGEYVSQVVTAPLDRPSLAGFEGELVVNAPVEGDIWSGTRHILWEANDLDPSLSVDLEISGDGGKSWLMLAQGMGDRGAYSWDTSEVPNGLYLLKLTAANDRMRQAFQSGPFAIANVGENAPRIALERVPPGEIWSGTREIRWHSWDDDGDALWVTLAYSLNMGASWQVFAQMIPDTSSYILDTGTIPSCDAVWLRATISDGVHESEAYSQEPFAIVNARGPLIRLVAPRGGVQWSESLPIEWQAANDAGRPLSVSLEASSDAGQSWGPVADGLPAQGSYLWAVSETSREAPLWLRAVASDGVRSAVDMVWPPMQPHSAARVTRLPFFAP